MDLNQLLFQHQLALINVARATSGETRNAYSRIVSHYAHQLREYRRARQVQQYDDRHNDAPSGDGTHRTPIEPGLEDIEMLDLTDARRNEASEEETMLALEVIANQLLLIHADLLTMDRLSNPSRADRQTAAPSGANAVDSWENEGGHVAARTARFDVPGMTKKTVDVYSVGPYSYTDLASALVELKRQRIH